MQNPFGPPPSDAMVKKTLIPQRGDLDYKFFVPDYKKSPDQAETSQRCSRCQSCVAEMIIYIYWGAKQISPTHSKSDIHRSLLRRPIFWWYVVLVLVQFSGYSRAMEIDVRNRC